MKIYLKVLVVGLCAFIFSSSNVQAQDYQSAIGLRLGVPLSLSYKTFINDNGHALEGYVSYRSFSSSYSWIGVNAGYQIHNEIAKVDRLYWYYGAGASVFFWNFNNNFTTGSDQTSVTFGIQGYLGLDYTLPNAPVNFSADWVPTFFINGFGNGFGAGYGSLAVRYILK